MHWVGTLQSPINILKKDAKVQYIGDLKFNYSSNSRGELWNNGHSIQYRIDNSTGYSTLTYAENTSSPFRLLMCF
jgi:carbonic anhydrase